MKSVKRSTLRILFWTLVAYGIFAYPVYVLGSKNLFISVSLGYILSIFNITFGYISISWSFDREFKTFLGMVLGGMLLRFVLLGLALFLITQHTILPVGGFLISFMLFYIYLQYHEIRYINLELKKETQNDRSSK